MRSGLWALGSGLWGALGDGVLVRSRSRQQGRYDSYTAWLLKTQIMLLPESTSRFQLRWSGVSHQKEPAKTQPMAMDE